MSWLFILCNTKHAAYHLMDLFIILEKYLLRSKLQITKKIK